MKNTKVAQVFEKYSIYIILVAMFILCSILNKNFLSSRNIINIARQLTVGIILAYGEMLLVISLCIGGLIGEIIGIEAGIERFGAWLKVKSHSERDPLFIEGFTSASFTLCIGAMAIIGPMNDAIYHEYSILITKGILDCIIVMALTSSMGKGPVFSVIPLAIWQGLMTILARLIAPAMTDAALANLSMVGNVLITCVGLNLAFPVRIKVANYLPALLIAVGWAFFS